MRRTVPALIAFALLTAFAAPKVDRLDAIAEAYVKLSLEAGVREDGYVDAYTGPAEWQAAAKANPRTQAQLLIDARALSAQLAATKLPAADIPRARFLAAQLKAAETRLAMSTGTKFSFEDEAEGLFGVRPKLHPLAHYDAVLARISALVPGEGELWRRVEAFQDRLTIPADKLDAVMRAAIDECRKRTAAHIPLPVGEKFTLEFVKDKPWSGYNYYQGDATSLIQINTDLPVRLPRAVDLGCHEGYPGHHLLGLTLDRELAQERGWIEFTVFPLFSPMGLIGEGTANYGIDLAFPGDEKLVFEQAVLYPLAGVDPALAKTQAELNRLTKDLAGARLTIAQLYLDGKIDRETAIGYAQTYQLMSRARAEQSIRFTEAYRSYVINYGLGEEMARAYIEAQAADQAGRWKAFARVISNPTVPADLLAR